MRARVVLIAVLCGAAVIASGCQQEPAQQDTPPPESSTSRSTMPTEPTGSLTTDTPGSGTAASPNSTRTMFDPEAMRTSVHTLLENTYRIDGVQKVSCPSDEEVADGNSFQCTVVINGKRKRVDITVRGDGGEYIVSPPQ